MLKLIDHIVRISARRDRTEINTALLEAMVDIFAPHALTVYRCFPSGTETVVFSCAGIGPAGSFSHNAYLPKRQFSWPIGQDKLLQEAEAKASIVIDHLANDGQRIVFPVYSSNRLIYLVDMIINEDLPAEQRVLIMGLIEYFTHHIALLDYGETDTLTGLANRKTFDKHLFEVMGSAANDEISPLSGSQKRRKPSLDGRHWLAVCDVDHFKPINDNHGHLIGDEVLVMFGRLMRESFRYDDQLFRFGGEEFIVVLQPASRVNAIRACERFRNAVERHVFPEAGQVRASIGICGFLRDDTPTSVMDRADAALYWAKQNGRNRTACYEDLLAAGSLAEKPLTQEPPAPSVSAQL